MERMIYCGIFLLLFFSCSNREKENEVGESDTTNKLLLEPKRSVQKETEDAVQRKDSLIISSDSTKIVFWNRGKWLIGDAKPMTIKGDHWFYHSHSLPENFCPDSVLCDFFPGRYYKIISDDYPHAESFVCWLRPNYREHFFIVNTFQEDTAIFPLKEGNETRFLDTLQWTQPDGKTYLLFSFSTSEIPMDFHLGTSGHYMPAALGLALFVRNESRWEFVSFCPALEFTGAWSSADPAEVAITGNSSFLILVPDHDCGPGGPQYNWRSFYAVDATSFKNVFAKYPWGVDGLGRYIDWTTQIISSEKNSFEPFPDLKLVSAGLIYKEDDDTFWKTFGLPEAEKYFLQKDIFKFVRTKKLKFENGKYVVTNTTMKVDTTYSPPK